MDAHRRPPPKGALSDERARALALAEVMRMEDAKRETQVWEPPRQTTRGRAISAAVLFLTALWVWVFPPEVISLTPASNPVVTEARTRAALRIAIGFQADRIEAFQDTNGRLPDQLAEVGEPILPESLMKYERLDPRTFRIRARTGGQVQRYASRDSLSVYMWNALRIFREEFDE